MTANEAPSFRCCGPQGTGKPNPHNPTERYCIGSKCMAWRWYNLPERSSPKTHGYCGLAGMTERE